MVGKFSGDRSLVYAYVKLKMGSSLFSWAQSPADARRGVIINDLMDNNSSKSIDSIEVYGKRQLPKWHSFAIFKRQKS